MDVHYNILCIILVVVQLLSYVLLFTAPWTAARQASPSFTISQSRLRLMSIVLMMPTNHFILCHPLLLLPSIFSSNRVFSNELVFQKEIQEVERKRKLYDDVLMSLRVQKLRIISWSFHKNTESLMNICECTNTEARGPCVASQTFNRHENHVEELLEQIPGLCSWRCWFDGSGVS